ncbi:MAG: radical SAM family heme chaperone HemW [Planctomycetes bacterium]|nr:radical SAM family heme chaperone HemW [Planctomycetota bacterium]
MLSLPLASAAVPANAGRALGTLAATVTADSLYIHVPFCFHKCHYCDFYSIVDTRDRQEVYVARLISELNALWPRMEPLRTVFIGGGTPSLLRPDLWKILLTALERVGGVASIPARGGEFTVECNPETVTPELMHILASGGVNRVSIGAQSFNPAHLKTLERWHDPPNVFRAVELARTAGILRQSIDLIFGIPGQTLSDWESDLELALSAQTEHLSCYGLTYEPNTAMAARLSRGEFAAIDEEIETQMFEHTHRALARRGLFRYEVSNFARPGAECRHNLTYWRQGNWLAAGPSASGHMAGLRWKNTPRLDDYLKPVPGDFSTCVDVEYPDARCNLTELVMTSLRLAEGIDADRMLAAATQIEPAISSRLVATVESLGSRGLLAVTEGRWRLTDAGFLVANRVIIEMMEAIDPDEGA